MNVLFPTSCPTTSGPYLVHIPTPSPTFRLSFTPLLPVSLPLYRQITAGRRRAFLSVKSIYHNRKVVFENKINLKAKQSKANQSKSNQSIYHHRRKSIRSSDRHSSVRRSVGRQTRLISSGVSRHCHSPSLVDLLDRAISSSLETKVRSDRFNRFDSIRLIDHRAFVQAWRARRKEKVSRLKEKQDQQDMIILI